jgi:hypothetical protein
MTVSKVLRVLCLLSIVPVVAQPQTTGNGHSEPSVITASSVTIPPRVDGLLTDDVWKQAVPITNFTQRQLLEGAPATERTEVRIIYDDHALYVGVWCYDSDPEGIAANQLRRDFDYSTDDNFELILDTYHDRRNGFLFVINPNGARFDALVTDEGASINQDWNGLWDARATITSEGWFAEMEIPFSTLRFVDDPEQIWGMNCERNIRRKLEQLLWQAYLRNYELEKLSQAGILRGLNNIHRGNAIEIKPYLLAGIQREPVLQGENQSTEAKVGLDVKYSLAPTLTLDFTAHTDFAQVEADRARINLTRFPLYFPEKRDFFLEGAGIFNFQFGESPIPFYSRRIGINENHELIPILGGIRLVGKAGTYNLGVLTMQTAESGGEPTTNYTVARVKQDVSEQSYVGFIGTNKQSSRSYNRLLGFDGAWVSSDVFGSNTLIVGGALAATTSPGITSNNLAYRLYVDYPNDFMDGFLGIRGVQPYFDPQLGFIDRSNFRQYSWITRIRPRPPGIGVQYLEFKPGELDYFVYPDGSLQSLDYEGRILGFQTNSGEIFEWNIQRFADSPKDEFAMYEDVTIFPGTYWWTRWELQLETNPSRSFSCWFLYSWGDFYNGTRVRYSLAPQVKLGVRVAISLDYTRNQVQLPSGSFVTDEAGAIIDYGFSTTLNSSLLAQWNNEDKEINVNLRLHWIPQIGSDVYLVYNHLFDALGRIVTSRSTLLAKIAYRFVI